MLARPGPVLRDAPLGETQERGHSPGKGRCVGPSLSPTCSFDGAVCTMALHHLPDLAPVFHETRRVLQAGRLVIFTSTCEQLAGYWLNEYFPVAMARSTEQMPSMAVVLRTLGEAGFTVDTVEPYGVRPDLQDLFLYAGKHRPELYLSETMRRGISTFSTLSDPGGTGGGMR